jgi:spermidine synthase
VDASFVVLAREETPRGELVLRRRSSAGSEPVYELIANGCFLMASFNAFSARQLSHLCLDVLRAPVGWNVLVGGLGMGFTLQAALEHSEVHRVTVVEIEPLIVSWAAAYFAPLNGQALADERVKVVVEDLAEFLVHPVGPFDAILIDIDNGPTWLMVDENAVVYSATVLERIYALLSEEGVLGVWAAETAPGFLGELRRIFDWADELLVQESVEGRMTDYFVYRAGKSPM